MLRRTRPLAHDRRGLRRVRTGAIALALLAIAAAAFLLQAWTAPSRAQEPAQVAQLQTPGLPRPPAARYVLLGWNDLGMHCMNESFANLAVLPPYNTLWAQVIREPGPGETAPQVITTGITVEYNILDNTYSAGKTNFWDHVKALFGA